MTEHFKITADASGVKVAADQVAAELKKMRAEAIKANHAIDEGVGGGNVFGTMRGEIRRTQAAFQAFTEKVLADVRSMNVAFATMRFPHVPTAAAMAPVVPGVGPDRHDPWSTARVGLGYPPSVPRDSGVYRPEAPYMGIRSKANRPLFNDVGDLSQGQMVQNAINAAIPMLAVAGVYGYAIKEADKQAASNTVFGFTAEKMGVNPAAFSHTGYQVAQQTGSEYADIQSIIQAQIQHGETDPNRAASNARLAQDMTAGGADGNAFIEALGKSGPEAAASIKAMAESAGLQVEAGATLNEMIAQLEDRFGGLSEKVAESQSAFGQLWTTIKENLGIVGGATSSGTKQTVNFLDAVAKGDGDKAGFLAMSGGVKGDGTTDFSNALKNIGDNPAIGGRTQQGFAALGGYMENRDVKPVIDMQNDALARLNEARKIGAINKDQHHEFINAVNAARQAGDTSALYDLAHRGFEASAPAAVNELKGAALPSSPVIRPPGNGAQGSVRVTISSDPSSPTPMTARGY